MPNTKMLLVLGLAVSSSLFAAQKKRVAVLDFDYATVSSHVAAIFGTNQDVGKGISDILVDRLVKSGTYDVVERKAISKIIAEQNFSNSDRADAGTAAKLGRVLGVDAIIIGSITQFGRDDKTTSIGGQAIGGRLGRYGLGGIGRKQAKAVVGINARMISTDTALILATAAGAGESQRSGTALLGSGGTAANHAGGAVDMSSSNFADTILGEAVHAAVGQLATQLEQQASRLPQKTVNVQGLVADVAGDTVILNVGTKAGVKVGDRLRVERPVREVRDPSTGKVIRRITDQVGEVAVTEADEASSVGKFTGSAPPKVGDVVSSAQ